MPRRSCLGLIVAGFLAVGLQGSAAGNYPAVFLSSYRWSADDGLLGGVSGIDLMDDGTTFVAISDAGAITQGRFQRDENGLISGIEAAPMRLMRGAGEAPLIPGRRDAEGLAVAPDGTIYVSFEGPARVLAYDGIDGAARNLPDAISFGRMQTNAALEALAIDDKGRIYTMPERSGGEDKPFPVFRYDGSEWSQPFAIPREGRFLPVGADFGPDDRLYVLERDFQGVAGFANRVRAFTLDGDKITATETILQTSLGAYINLEGLSVWRDEQGRIRLTMVSDDNYRFYLAQDVVEYALPVDEGTVAD